MKIEESLELIALCQTQQALRSELDGYTSMELCGRIRALAGLPTYIDQQRQYQERLRAKEKAKGLTPERLRERYAAGEIELEEFERGLAGII